MHHRMTMAISPKDVVNALKPLNNEQSKELFFQLNVQLSLLDGIDNDYKGNMRKIHYVQAWLDCEVGASWEMIVAGLNQIGLNALAETLNNQYCMKGAHNPDLPLSPAIAPEASSFLSPVPRPLSPSLSSEVSQARDEIDKFSDTFSDIMSAARDEMCKMESSDPQFLDRFRDRLLGLPVTKKAPHVKFFYRNEDDFLTATDMHKIFAILRRYCTYCNYEVIKVVVRKFCGCLVRQRMEEYCQSLERFEKSTVIDVYLEAISAGCFLSEEFNKMVMLIDRPTSVCTLYEIRKLKETLSESASLEPYSVYIGEVSRSSVELALGFPAICEGLILEALTTEFLVKNLLLEVVVVGQLKLSFLKGPQGKSVRLIHSITTFDVNIAGVLWKVSIAYI